jgi:Putative restriction endonuclease
VDRDGGLLRASDVLVVVEIASPGSQRLDHVVKRHEYADAGIGHYWIVDLDEPVTLLDCHLADHSAMPKVAASLPPSPPPHHARSAWSSTGYCAEEPAGASQWLLST